MTRLGAQLRMGFSGEPLGTLDLVTFWVHMSFITHHCIWDHPTTHITCKFRFWTYRPLRDFTQVRRIIGRTVYSALWTTMHHCLCYLSRIFRTRFWYAPETWNHLVTPFVDHSSLYCKQTLRMLPFSCHRMSSKRSKTDLRKQSSNRKRGASLLRFLHMTNRMYSSLVLI